MYGGQYRYFYFYDKKLKKNLTVPILPYPKETSIQNDLEVKTSYGQNESKVNFEEFKKLLNKEKAKSISEKEKTLNKFFS